MISYQSLRITPNRAKCSVSQSMELCSGDFCLRERFFWCCAAEARPRPWASQEVAEMCFTGIASQLGGLGFEQIALRSLGVHDRGFSPDGGLTVPWQNRHLFEGNFVDRIIE